MWGHIVFKKMLIYFPKKLLILNRLIYNSCYEKKFLKRPRC